MIIVLLLNSWRRVQMFFTTVTQANPLFFRFINEQGINVRGVEKLKGIRL